MRKFPIRYAHYFFISLIKLFKTKLIKDMIMAAIIVIPNPSISKVFPRRTSVSHSVMALMMNRNRPSDRIVIGKVNITSTGRTIAFKIDKMSAANKAPLTPSISMDWNNAPTAIMATALTIMCNNQFFKTSTYLNNRSFYSWTGGWIVTEPVFVSASI